MNSVENIDTSLQDWGGEAQDSYVEAELQRAQATINDIAVP